MIQNYINHIVFVIDRSGSMQSLSNQVVSFFDSEIQSLAKRSQELNQETRISIYLFNGTTECLAYDMDVMRLPSLKSFYKADGSTALIDATILAISDAIKNPPLYGDNSYLYYILTDGLNNINPYKGPELTKLINSLPDNHTLAIFVPNALGVSEAKKFGFPAQNIAVWETTSRGLSETQTLIRKSTETYMLNRSKGVRGTKSLFNFDTSALTTSVVVNNLTELSPTTYKVFPVSKEMPIKEFVEGWTKESYRIGSAYYLITKAEKIQANKSILVQDKLNGKVYAGAEARNLLGLPNYEVKVNPVDHTKFLIYVQSSSVNRKLVPGTPLIVIN